MFLIQQGNDEDALKLISRVYKCESEDQKSEILNQLKSTMSPTGTTKDSEEKPSIKQAMFGRNYRRATWIVFIWTFFF